MDENNDFEIKIKIMPQIRSKNTCPTKFTEKDVFFLEKYMQLS